MKELNLACNYDLFASKHTMPGAFESNKDTYEDLQTVVRLEQFVVPPIIEQVPYNSLYKGNEELQLDPLKSEDNLTHWKFSDLTPIPLVPMSMGNIQSMADLNRTTAVSVGETDTLFHNFEDLYYLRDNKLRQ